MRVAAPKHKITATTRLSCAEQASWRAYDRCVSESQHAATSVVPLLVFDGDCAFCTTWVKRLERLLPVFPAHSPWQWLDLDALGLSRHDVTHYVWYLSSGHHYAGHLAVSALLRSQPRFGWRFLGNLIATPPFSWLAAAAYHVVARYRHKLPGGTPACAVPSPGGTHH